MRDFVNQATIAVRFARAFERVQRRTHRAIAGCMNFDGQSLCVQRDDVSRKILGCMHQLADPCVTECLARLVRFEHGRRIGRRNAVEHDFREIGVYAVRRVISARIDQRDFIIVRVRPGTLPGQIGFDIEWQLTLVIEIDISLHVAVVTSASLNVVTPYCAICAMLQDNAFTLSSRLYAGKNLRLS